MQCTTWQILNDRYLNFTAIVRLMGPIFTSPAARR